MKMQVKYHEYYYLQLIIKKQEIKSIEELPNINIIQ